MTLSDRAFNQQVKCMNQADTIKGHPYHLLQPLFARSIMLDLELYQVRSS